MQKAFFITGTDTDVGKTYVAHQLLNSAQAQGFRTLGYKPVSAGCEWRNERLENDDALVLLSASNVGASLEEVNPIAFAPPIAPHIAAQLAGKTISVNDIVNGYRHLQSYSADVLLMEGAGGWRLPLSNNTQMPEAVKALKLPVIIVVGMRLGCLNHAILTAEAIQHDGLEIAGWVANKIDPNMPYYKENLATLDATMPAPRLGEIGYQQSTDNWQHLNGWIALLG